MVAHFEKNDRQPLFCKAAEPPGHSPRLRLWPPNTAWRSKRFTGAPQKGCSATKRRVARFFQVFAGSLQDEIAREL
jgi:hypothetical protein